MQKKKIIFAITKLFFHNKIKLMKPFYILSTLILGAITSFSITNANAGGCSSHIEKRAEIECLSDDKKCIDTKDNESLYKVEA